MDEDFRVTCPCCNTKILVDYKTGAVLSHERPDDGGHKTFEQMVADNTKRKKDAEDVFSQAVREHENREELLDKKFKEAFERAEKDGSPPPHPFEYD